MSKVMPSRGNIDYTQHTGARGGGVLGRTRDFLKEADVFREDKGPGARQDYSAKDNTAPKDKSLAPVKPRS